MFELNEGMSKLNIDHRRVALERRIAATDRQIDKLVYDLYGLTTEEVAIVESTTECEPPVRASVTVA